MGEGERVCFILIHYAGVYILKTHQMFSVQFENVTITGHFAEICVRGKLGEENHMIIVMSSLSKSSVLKMFSVRSKTQSWGFQTSSV